MAGKVITCAFCGGAGKDPFGVMSPLSTCQVCGGQRSVAVEEPAVRCAFCGGSGVHRDQRLTCTACAGKGMISVHSPHTKCPRCEGTGVDPMIDYLPCVLCKGAAVVRVKEGAKVVGAIRESPLRPAD